MLDHCERDISAAAFFFFKTYYPLRYIIQNQKTMEMYQWLTIMLNNIFVVLRNAQLSIEIIKKILVFLFAQNDF